MRLWIEGVFVVGSMRSEWIEVWSSVLYSGGFAREGQEAMSVKASKASRRVGEVDEYHSDGDSGEVS